MAWYHRILNIVRSNPISRDIDRELAFHVEERADELIARGMSPDEARLLARRQFGNATSQREATRSADIADWVQSVAGDVRYALRGLVHTPVFAIAAILLARPRHRCQHCDLHPDRCVAAATTARGQSPAVVLQSGDFERCGRYFTNPLWEQIRDRQTAFAHAASFGGTTLNLTDGGGARRALGQMVSGDFFNTLDVRPVIGRVFTLNDDRRGCAPTAVLGYGFLAARLWWRSRCRRVRDPTVRSPIRGHRGR
ncbi:MAG: permease prefix domain 1-containing protein [Gemmatimonadaceae bacterium]